MKVVIKLGGEVVDSPRLAGIAGDVRRLVEEKHEVVLVHGGGPQATALGEKLGVPSRMVGGRRVTDEATLDVIKMTIAGRLNVDLCAGLRRAGVRPLGLHGAVTSVKRPPKVISSAGPDPIDLGLVGDVTGIDRGLLAWATGDGRVPVLACLGSGDDGSVYNINADVVASRLAVELGADLLVLVTSTDGVRRDVKDKTSRIPALTVEAGRRAIADGTIAGGMIPKVEEAFAALKEGVRSILIVEDRIAAAIADPGSVGTRLDP